MEISKYAASSFHQGWLVGNFSPSLHKTEHFEFGVKSFVKGAVEPMHLQKIAHELSSVVSGNCRIGSVLAGPGDCILIPPGVPADFEALTDCVIAVLKWPSIPSDKVVVD